MTKEMLREVLYQEIEHYHTDSLSKDGQVSRAPRPSQLLLPAQGDIRPADGLCVRVALCCCRWSRTPARSGMPRPVPRSAPIPCPSNDQHVRCCVCALASRSRFAQSDGSKCWKRRGRRGSGSVRGAGSDAEEVSDDEAGRDAPAAASGHLPKHRAKPSPSRGGGGQTALQRAQARPTMAQRRAAEHKRRQRAHQPAKPTAAGARSRRNPVCGRGPLPCLPVPRPLACTAVRMPLARCA